MKNKTAIQIFALMLTLALALSLTACGQSSEPVSTPEEYVYTSAFAPISGQATDALDVKSYTEDGAYAVCYDLIGREIPDGADIEGLTEEELSRFDKYAPNIYFIGNDGQAERLANYTPLEGLENTDGHKDFYSQSDISTVVPLDNGELLAVEYIYTGWYDGPEGKTQADSDYYDYVKNVQSFYLRTLGPTGAELKRVPLELEAEDYFRASSVTDGKGNLLGSTGYELAAFDSEGHLAYSIDCGGYAESILKLADGRIYVTLWGEGGLSLVPLDSDTGTLGESTALPSDAFSPMAGFGEYDICYTSGINFYGFDVETGNAEKLFNWIGCDINSDEVSRVRVNADGSVNGVLHEYDLSGSSCENKLFTVSKTLYDPSTAKSTLKLACLTLSDALRSAVLQFNRSNDSARIEIVDYSEFNTGDDSETGAQKLLTELMAGDVADIIALEGLPYKRIAAKGILEDLYPYIDADSELSREDCFANIFAGLEVGGKLCCVCPSFSLTTVMGAVPVVGDKPGWTYEDFNAALEKMPEGCEPFEAGVSRDDILRVCTSLDMASYVDWTTGKCSFDSPQFAQLLDFASSFPQDHSDGSEDDTQQRISSGQQMLLATGIYSLDDALYDSAYFGGQDVCYIGFPTADGSGSIITPESCAAMSASCADKQAAWEFLRVFLTEDYQESSIWSIPTSRAVYEQKLAQMMKTTYAMDDNGQYVLDANGEKIKEPRYTMSVGNGPVVSVYAMTAEQAQAVSDVVNSATRFYDYDEGIVSIVCEEAAAYFSGQKTAEETAKLIQSKATIYVNEQK